MFLMRRHLVTYYFYHIYCKGPRCGSLFASFSFSLSLPFTLFLSLCLFFTHTHTLSLSLTPSLSFALSLLLSFSLSLSYSLTLSLSLSLSLSHSLIGSVQGHGPYHVAEKIVTSRQQLVFPSLLSATSSLSLPADATAAAQVRIGWDKSISELKI